MIDIFGTSRNEVEAELQRRRERLGDVPISASLLGPNEMDLGGIRDTREAVAAVPGLNWTTDTGNERSNNITIRGIGANVIGGGVDPGVAMYIDDVFIGRMAGFGTDFVGLDRIEVLRGPQGSLYGKNAIGGAVKQHLAPPGMDNSAAARIDGGTYAYRRALAHANVAVIPDRLAARISVGALRQDGTVHDRSTGRDINDRDNWGTRLQMLARPNPDVEYQLNLDHAQDRATRTAIAGFDDALRYVTDATRPYDSHRDNSGITAKALWRTPGFDVASVTAVRHIGFGGEGSDFSGKDQWQWGQFDDHKQVSQEVRLSSNAAGDWRWQGGVFLYADDYHTRSYQELHSIAALFGKAYGYRETSVANERQWNAALFGEVEWTFVPTWRLTLGGRLSHENKWISYSHAPGATGAVLGVSQTVTTDRDYQNISPKMVLAHDLDPGVMAYVKVERGYKSGGFNDAFSKTSTLHFNPETAWNYEAGLKSTFLDDSVDLNLATYCTDWRHPQVQMANPTGTITGNSGSARILGGEAELAWRPAKGWEVSSGLGYMDARYLRYANHPTRDATGNRLPYSSRLTSVSAIQYQRFVTPWTKLFGRVEWQYRSSLYFDALNELRQPGYGIANLTVGAIGDGWRVDVWGKNLLDKAYRIGAADYGTALGGKVAGVGEPRMIGAGLSVEF
ncbi:hypothetical protein A6A04_16190 [Paramagnetospirillum marisnigri]|uniref:TonB-dependent receptor n=2 Tax=Paramagnetospirillum marisnigri TaxID=1285242 RepID=A0A178MSL1_9PROT|nr:hypothetical protein A6A04_16190 [Paramagnetospirillum marisnigri]